MKNRYPVLSLWLVLIGACASQAVVLPPEKLLPKDTLAVITAPDTRKFLNLATNSAIGKLWRSPEMKPFRDKFEDKLKAAFEGSLQKDLGIKLEDLTALAQGQTTFAVLPNAQADQPGDRFTPILLVDARDHAEQLKQTLADVKKKWADAGKPMKVEKILDFDFTTFSSPEAPPKTTGTSDANTPDDGAAAVPPPKKSAAVIIGQVESMLVISSSSDAIGKILSRIEGGLTPALEEQPAFQADYSARLRQAPGYAWVNAKALTDLFLKGNPDDPVAPGSLSLPTILSATGLSDITSAAFTLQNDSDGTVGQLYVSVPEANRRGLIKAFAIEAKDSSPPPFVPADAVKFFRWRVNLRQTWDTLEKMLNDINPNAANLVNFVLTSAGKDKDDKYDLKAELLDNVGDDVISYVKSPSGATLENFKSPPGVVLIGSPNPDKLAAAIKVALGALVQATGGVKEQDFLGRKIYSLSMPGAKGEVNPLSFAASGSYVAFSGQSDMVEEFLRSDEGKSKPLSGVDGLADAAAKVGGMGTGFFEYDNVAQAMKTVFDLVHSQNLTLSDLVGAPPNQSSTPSMNPAEQLAKLKEWTDFSLLPPFDAVSKYFYFGAQSARFTSDGFSWTMFAPTPPRMR
jgi:hypothetical protein